MNILIIGGTRFLGPYVIKELTEDGHKVTIFHRGQTNIELPDGVGEILGDRKQLFDYANKLWDTNPDVIIDMFPYSEKDAVDLSAVFCSSTARMIALSSADVYQAYGRLIGLEKGNFTKEVIKEDSPLRSIFFPYRSTVKDEHDWRYHYDKILIENYYMQHSSLPATILRLPMIYGPHDRQHRLWPYLQCINQEQAISLDPREVDWRTCRGYVENVAHAIALAAVHERAANQIYNVAEEVNFSEKEWVETIQQYCQSNLPIKMIKNEALDFYPEQDLFMDSQKIRLELGYKEIVPFSQGMLRTIQWENENPPV
ncbi:NAD-dependent epimerase/dehydratase family protein [Heyndrickxia acidicola]|uniref:NAD-dependent epimerase/dehydratase family protein n=1 Tax=Heyndrickxia acidicola TaxID=209389 RepID=A0ABU6MBW1_9BACI|nr:NAD-dependent epimerase/dehydratase family protein [Heyndrickxia acidicola]MED1201764.1 NAD-dependent epimerase/dehydratase family protein [Heyndrickxia acidicola]